MTNRTKGTEGREEGKKFYGFDESMWGGVAEVTQPGRVNNSEDAKQSMEKELERNREWAAGEQWGKGR